MVDGGHHVGTVEVCEEVDDAAWEQDSAVQFADESRLFIGLPVDQGVDLFDFGLSWNEIGSASDLECVVHTVESPASLLRMTAFFRLHPPI